MGRYAEEVKIIGADVNRLMEISEKNLLSLNLDEMRIIQDYFTSLGRNPTDCEIETIAQTWSEHCYHKIFRADIEYTEKSEKTQKKQKITLLKEIKKATDKVKGDFCISVFKDNAGIIKFDNKYGIAFKVETHNHPSALEPYGGAGTGIGGVIRDILGAGKGAFPILNTDIFCFGLLDASYDKLPEGVLHPRRVFRGVVSGVRDYGNRMGIPTASGAIIFDEGYQNNCLVYCGTLGVIPLDKVEKKVCNGDYVVVVGGRTGRDGIHGATFSSVALDKDISTSVVQIGNPIVEKKMMDVLIKARDENLYNAVTDCGAGGLSSAVGEMGKDVGAVVYLEQVPLKYEGLAPWEIWVSESQERMVLAVPEKNLTRLLQLFSEEDVEATVIGQFIKSGKLEIFYNGEQVCCLDMNFLHRGLPPRKLKASFYLKRPLTDTTTVSGVIDWKERIFNVLGSSNIASKEAVITQYDHEVQAHTIIKPLTGMYHDGPSDAVVLNPLYDRWKGIAVACGINPFYGKIDPYYMAGCCIEEALRNLVAVGADPTKVAILDNFCWGDVNNEENLGALTRCVKGCYDFATGYKLPFISGKDSLNNFFIDKKTGVKTSIPGTLLISSVGIVSDIRKTVTSNLKKEGSCLYICGKTHNEMGMSEYYRVHKIEGGKVPEPLPAETFPLMKKIHKGIKSGIIKSCHDCSDGGFIVALMEMAMGGEKGVSVYLDNIPSSNNSIDVLLFSESQGRFIVEVDRKFKKQFENIMAGSDVRYIGNIEESDEVKVYYKKNLLVEIVLKEAIDTWKGGLKW
ncbi:MAG TPA: phosphoribosylformylglycinamidine synthase subunit PurL [bacterium]|nr:phosphoribosylformylglycinamidine synthase subunit PurL [bacterium]HPP29939.1 phosphoribosylformylglycinamidine synthase subunit PurL [bacterium]